MIKSLINKFRSLYRFRNSDSNSINNNLVGWSNYNWTKLGEEWSNNPEWKASVIEFILKPNIPIKSKILEIGPGGGRWTEHIITIADSLILVDLTPQCIEICKNRFKNYNKIQYFVNDGKSLDFIQTGSIDIIWSWDVFVHIQSEDIKNYIRQFARILNKEGKAIIHHSKNGKYEAGWRSDMTAKKMVSYSNEYGLEVLEQFVSWNEDRMLIYPSLPKDQSPDIVTIIKKP